MVGKPLWHCIWGIVLVSSLNAFHQITQLRPHYSTLSTKAKYSNKLLFPANRLLCVPDNSVLYNPLEDESDFLFHHWKDYEKGNDISDDEEYEEFDTNDDSEFLEPESIPRKNYEKPPMPLTPGTPIEFLHNGTLYFGNYISPGESVHSISVLTSSGRKLVVSIGSVITGWESLVDAPPQTMESWAAVISEAMGILRSLPPRTVDLEDLWTLIRPFRLYIPRLDSLDVAKYLFHEREFKRWLKGGFSPPQKPLKFTAAQRYAAAVLLQGDSIHFKRRECQRIWLEDWLVYQQQQQDQSTPEGQVKAPLILDTAKDHRTAELVRLGDAVVFLVSGGFSILDESVSLFLQSEHFVSYYHEKTTNALPVVANNANLQLRQSCVSKVIRQLELYTLANQLSSPHPLVRKVMRAITNSSTCNPALVRKILQTLGNAETTSTRSSSTTNYLTSSDLGQSPQKFRRLSVTMLHSAESIQEETAKLLDEVDLLYSQYDYETPRGFPLTKHVGQFNRQCGRVDLRHHSLHPAICIDHEAASFLDDAFSYDPDRNQVFIHVVDVTTKLHKYPVLSAYAQEQMFSVYLNGHKGKKEVYHVLPPKVLEALSLSTSGCNEVITVALQFDPHTGEMVKQRVFPAVIGPIHALSIPEIDELVTRDFALKDEEAMNQLVYSHGVPSRVIQTVQSLAGIARRLNEKDPWIGVGQRSKVRRQQSWAKEYPLNNKQTQASSSMFDFVSPAHQVINTFLTLYSNVTVEYCRSKRLPVPIVWDNRDTVNNQIIRRHGTQPLRNYIAQLQQQQICSALGMDVSALNPPTIKQHIQAYKLKKQELILMLRSNVEKYKLLDFEQYCTRERKQLLHEQEVFGAMEHEDFAEFRHDAPKPISTDVIVRVQATTGVDSNVIIVPFQVPGMLLHNQVLPRGAKGLAKVKEIQRNEGLVLLELVEKQ